MKYAQHYIFRSLFAIFILLQLSFHAKSQTIDSSALVSVLTCAPGSELYSSFGHIAIRIQDPEKGFDYVYNYGTFDFDTPNFYLKFVRGKLLYLLTKDAFPNFMYEYQMEQRSVTEQVLDLTFAQKELIYSKLETNLLPENRSYKYDFLIDNCATRPRDILFNNLPIQLKDSIVGKNTTSRDLIHYYLDRSGQPWSKLGIDILLGARLDKNLTNREAMFLPDFLMKGLDEATISGQKLIDHKESILSLPAATISTNQFLPLIVISSISFFLFLIYYFSKGKKLAHILDIFLFGLTGLFGIFLLFMWFGTDHTVCQENMNLMWALAPNIIVIFFLKKSPNWLRIYFFLAFIITVLLLSCWFIIPQQINIALAPFVLLMMYRYGIWCLGKKPSLIA